MTYAFEYERTAPRRRPRKEIRPRPAPPRRAAGILFSDGNWQRAYFYDLYTRWPVSSKIKRALDVLMSTMLIVLLSPVLLSLMALVKLTSPGKIMFRQRRIGFRGNRFFMYKFRTMYTGAHLKEKEMAQQAGGSFLKVKNDPRITPIGRFLRKYSLDELPQLFNVLEGTMSMVGPRPLLPSDLAKLPCRGSIRRFCMPPGITGLWQVAGRSDCSEVERMQLDGKYYDDWSLALDCKLLFQTIAVVVTGRGAA